MLGRCASVADVRCNPTFTDTPLACKHFDCIFIDEWDDTFCIKWPVYQLYYGGTFYLV